MNPGRKRIVRFHIIRNRVRIMGLLSDHHSQPCVSRLIHFRLRLGIKLVFILEGRPQRNEAIENFNGWFQGLPFSQHLSGPVTVRRELRHLMRGATTNKCANRQSSNHPRKGNPFGVRASAAKCDA